MANIGDYKIYSRTNELAVEYHHSTLPSESTLTFHNIWLKGDVQEGVRVPISLQVLLGDKDFLPYPKNAEEVDNFALAYMEIIFKKELIKHGYYLEEDKIPLSFGKA